MNNHQLIFIFLNASEGMVKKKLQIANCKQPPATLSITLEGASPRLAGISKQIKKHNYSLIDKFSVFLLVDLASIKLSELSS